MLKKTRTNIPTPVVQKMPMGGRIVVLFACSCAVNSTASRANNTSSPAATQVQVCEACTPRVVPLGFGFLLTLGAPGD